MKTHLRHTHGRAVCGRSGAVETDPALVNCRDCFLKHPASFSELPAERIQASTARLAESVLEAIKKESYGPHVPTWEQGSTSFAQRCLRLVIARLQEHVMPSRKA